MDKIAVNQKEFEIIKLLGKGKGGYSCLCKDGQKQVVVKKIHHEPCSYYTFGNKIESECNDYQRLSNIGVLMPKMLDVDKAKETILNCWKTCLLENRSKSKTTITSIVKTES